MTASWNARLPEAALIIQKQREIQKKGLPHAEKYTGYRIDEPFDIERFKRTLSCTPFFHAAVPYPKRNCFLYSISAHL